MTTHEVGPQPTSLTAPGPQPQRRKAGTAALVSLALLVVGTGLAARPDLASTADLHDFLASHGPRLFAGWVAMTLSGVAWLLFVVAIRTLLPGGLRRDLFTFAAVAGQVCVWIGSALATAPAPAGARALSMPTYLALDEASHLSSATGLTLTGLALLCLASCGAEGVAVPRWFVRVTWTAGALLFIGSVVGPLGTPVHALWMLAATLVLARRPRGRSKPDRAAPPA